MNEPLTVFSIGHSNQSIADFLELLSRHDIEVLVDVRSSPYARYAVQFNAPALEQDVVAAGRRYLYLGRELGGRPEGIGLYDEEGHVLYGRVAETPVFQSGIDRLIDGAGRYRVAIMCSEENPSDCHRRLLIGRVLAGQSVELIHIRGDGSLLREADLVDAEARDHPEKQQLALFGQATEEPWRSIRSVSPRSPRSSSSEP